MMSLLNWLIAEVKHLFKVHRIKKALGASRTVRLK